MLRVGSHPSERNSLVLARLPSGHVYYTFKTTYIADHSVKQIAGGLRSSGNVLSSLGSRFGKVKPGAPRRTASGTVIPGEVESVSEQRNEGDGDQSRGPTTGKTDGTVAAYGAEKEPGDVGPREHPTTGETNDSVSGNGVEKGQGNDREHPLEAQGEQEDDDGDEEEVGELPEGVGPMQAPRKFGRLASRRFMDEFAGDMRENSVGGTMTVEDEAPGDVGGNDVVLPPDMERIGESFNRSFSRSKSVALRPSKSMLGRSRSLAGSSWLRHLHHEHGGDARGPETTVQADKVAASIQRQVDNLVVRGPRSTTVAG